MKPLILPCVLNEDGNIVISKEALDSLIDKAYEAGVEDGQNMAMKAVRIIKEPPDLPQDMPMISVYAAPARPYPYNYGDITTTTSTAYINEEGGAK